MEKIKKESGSALSYNTSFESNWTNYVSKELKWLSNINTNVEGESEDIVERFTSMSNINRSYNRKADREEIRKRLATGSDSDDYYNSEKINRKPSLQTRLQSGMNLQICFMNENTSDSESINSDSEVGNSGTQISNLNNSNKSITKRPDSLKLNKFNIDEVSLNHGKPMLCFSKVSLMEQEELKKKLLNGSDFFTCQVQLQAEARLALAQAKEMAQMQIELEKQRLKVSPITDMIRKSLEKVGVSFPEDRRRLSRQILTEMNIAQLQIIANDLHSKIEELNEKLVRYLIGRDDMHMEQDSMLVDIEDLTRYLDANRCGT